ncbi:maltose alpha-D-glucosyltransferase [Methylobacillus arboreus]|uniref:maltose alpha-D-glucosyltransferase n=1 Tax=Methylobacillus arboreus TaxID=755170 RepID=UPI001E51A8FD|nr:maltose alpha-D-glucosyltransferase [Methylobacillus arboreus]MCB5191461.1 maltose alpha-D-glucosyltransferase [Methylobacillus arboreus]
MTKEQLQKKTRAEKNLRFNDDPLWYKDAVIYQVHIKSFFDANNDGIGDFAGLIRKLDYIAELGVNTIWLLPFYPSPRRDDGYDIAEYRGVHADYGILSDAKRFIAEAHKRNLRVITELIINHTSDQHPWFQRARHAKPGSAARNFYVWSDTDTAYSETRIIFTDTEKSNWAWDPVAGAYYWHRFFSHQPDLNFDNPQVLKSIINIMRFWLDLGVDGLRLDAVPYLIEREGTSNENLPETHDILKRIRREIDQNYPDRMLLAEANMWPEDVQQYFGNGEDECHMAFHFPLMPRIYLALAQQDRFPITDILRQTPDIPPTCQWAIFLRNHDELTLEMVTDNERAYMLNFYAAESRARLNVGIRRRLAPLLQRDRRRLELLNSLLLSMPGTPVIYYGDEIGMGDNIHLGDRDGVRTPMQWSPDRNGGFSNADPARLVLPPIMDTQYGYHAINVESQNSDPHSLLNWMRHLLAVRRQYHAFGRGSMRLLYPGNRKILSYLRIHTPGGENAGKNADDEQVILCVANISSTAQAVELNLAEFSGYEPVEMLGGSVFPRIGQQPYILTLAAYDFYWFLLTRSKQPLDAASSNEAALPEYLTLVLNRDLSSLFGSQLRQTMEQDILPAYLPHRRWYSGKQEHAPPAIKLVLLGILEPLASGDSPVLLTQADTSSDIGQESYFLPMGIFSDDQEMPDLARKLAFARVRQGPRIGVLTDAFALGSFIRTLVHHLRHNSVLDAETGSIHFNSTKAFHEIDWKPGLETRRTDEEQSNSSLIIGDIAVIKLLRRVRPGINPALEMARHLGKIGHANTPQLLGDMTFINAVGIPHTQVIMQAFMHNQGNAWQWTLDRLGHVLHDNSSADLAKQALAVDDPSPLKELTTFAGILGQRLAELHNALGSPSADPDFNPEIFSSAQVEVWQRNLRTQLDAALELLEHSPWPDEMDATHAAAILARQEQLAAVIDRLAQQVPGQRRFRIHGDFHLGQVLMMSGDVMIIDFEGDPARSLAQCRQKDHPLRDVAGLLRSFSHAAAQVEKSDINQPASDGAQHRQELLQNYEACSKQVFMQAYCLHHRAPEKPRGIENYQYLPPDEQAVLDLCLLEKMLHEIASEAANRPAWTGIPLRGLLGLLNELNPDAP